MRERRREDHCRHYWPICCSMRSTNNWSGAGTPSSATPTTAMSMCGPSGREITRRNGGRSLSRGIGELRRYLPGWKRYFQLADTPGVFADHDKWIRHRLRALQLKQWKRGPKVYAEMRRLGLSQSAAAQAAFLERRWWHRAAKLVQVGLTTRYYDRLGVPRLAD